MRTTVDIPDELLRKTKATAALRGMKMKDLIVKLIESGLSTIGTEVEPRLGHRTAVPVLIPASGRKIPVLTNAQIFEILDQEDDEAHGRLS